MELVATLSCVDQPGIVNAVTSAILAGSGNILENQQFTDPTTNRFVMRTKFVTGLQVSEVSEQFNQSLQKFNVDLEILPADYRKKVIIFVSKESHCLRDLIYLTEIGDLPIEIVAVISNHETLKPLATAANLKFIFINNAINKETNFDYISNIPKTKPIFKNLNDIKEFYDLKLTNKYLLYEDIIVNIFNDNIK